VFEPILYGLLEQIRLLLERTSSVSEDLQEFLQSLVLDPHTLRMLRLCGEGHQPAAAQELHAGCHHLLRQ
jgi:hypothetical protein